MLKFVLNVLLLRRFLSSRPAMRAVLVIFLVLTVLGFFYAALVFHVTTERSHPPHVHAHSTH